MFFPRRMSPEKTDWIDFSPSEAKNSARLFPTIEFVYSLKLPGEFLTGVLSVSVQFFPVEPKPPRLSSLRCSTVMKFSSGCFSMMRNCTIRSFLWMTVSRTA